ncbi:EGFlike domain containing protein, partial [Acanthamoeba castellanii str. Neff]
TLPIARAEDVTASQIKSTYLIVPDYEIIDPQARSLPLPSSGCHYKLRNNIALLLFGTYGLELPSFFLYDAVEGFTSTFGVFTDHAREFNLAIGGDRCQVYCEGDSSNAYDPSEPGVTCSASSSNSFAILLEGATQNCNCPTTALDPLNAVAVELATAVSSQPAACALLAGLASPVRYRTVRENQRAATTASVKPRRRPIANARPTGPVLRASLTIALCQYAATTAQARRTACAPTPTQACPTANASRGGRSAPTSTAPSGANECSGRGSCNRTSGLCSCPPGWRGVDCSHTDCPGSPDCNHHGECVVNGTTDAVECRCSPGWIGPDCSVAECAAGATECSNHGKCVDVGLDPPRCVCAAGWTGPDCSVALTACASAPNCDVCVAGNGTSKYCTACNGDWRGADCNTPYCLSVNDFSVFPECSGHGSCLAGGAAQPACQCRPGWASGPLNDCFSPTCAAAQGQAECSGHGACSTDLASPACMCDPYFYGNSCSIYEPMCPGFPDECTDSEHGTCVNGTCQCGDNWRGSDCSVVRCPGAEENCNGRGRCDSSVEPAECRCDARWTGPDCATPICPGDCSGNGQCNGDTNPPVCMCLPFWGGADCSESQERGSSSSDQSTTYAAVGGALGGGAVALVVGVAAAYGVFKGLAAYKTYQINKGLNIGQVNFALDEAHDTL